MKAPSRVFISATSADLSSVRKTVTDALLTMGCHPVAQDHFSPDFRTVANMLEEKLKPCQAVIHIVGHRFGAEPDPSKLPPGTPRRSYTQMEFDMARKLGIKTYVFICPDDFPFDQAGQPEPDELRALQDAHRKAILEGEWVYTTVEDRAAVANSVHKLQLELDEMRGTVERGKKGILFGIAALLAALLLIGGGIAWMVNQSGKQSAALSQIQTQLDRDRLLLGAVLAKVKESQRVNAELTPEQRIAAAVQEVAREESIPVEQVQGAMDLFVASVEVDPRATSYDKAMAAMSEGDFEKAATLAQTEVEDAEQSSDGSEKAKTRLARAYALLGDALYGALKFDDAVAAFQKAAQFFDPRNAIDLWSESKFWAASSMQKLGKKDEAQAILSEIAEASPATSTGEPRDPGNITLKAPSTAPIGAEIMVEVTGSGHRWDYLTIVPQGAPQDARGNYAYVRADGPVQLSAELQPGDYEVRLFDYTGRRVLSSTPVKLTAMDVTLKAPDKVPAGGEFQVEWAGPDGNGDYVSIVIKGADRRKYNSYVYTRNANPVTIRALDTPGEYEVRYVSGQDSAILASIPVQVVPTPASVGGPEEVMGGSTVKVPWTGPGHQGDYVTIVEAGVPEGKYNHYVYAKNDKDKVAEVKAPETPGSFEIRYVTGYEAKTIATAPIKITPIVASVSSPSEAIAGSEVEVTWTGPGNQSDFITIVAKGTPDKKYAKYVYARNAKPVEKVLAIETPGEAEVRYLTAGGNVASRHPILILEAKARFLENPATVEADGRFQPQWEGPNNPSDLIVLTKAGENGNRHAAYIYARNGHAKNELRVPKEPGSYELRYVTGQDQNVLARVNITVK